MRAILSRVKLNKKQIVGLLLLTLVASVAEMLLPTMLASMIDTGIPQGSKSYIFTFAIIMGALAILACLTNVAATRISAKISTKFAADVRREIFHKVQDLSAAEIDKFGTASLVTRSTSDVTNVQTFLSLLLRMGGGRTGALLRHGRQGQRRP